MWYGMSESGGSMRVSFRYNNMSCPPWGGWGYVEVEGHWSGSGVRALAGCLPRGRAPRRKAAPTARAEPPRLSFPSSGTIALLALGLLGSMVGVFLLVNIV